MEKITVYEVVRKCELNVDYPIGDPIEAALSIVKKDSSNPRLKWEDVKTFVAVKEDN